MKDVRVPALRKVYREMVECLGKRSEDNRMRLLGVVFEGLDQMLDGTTNPKRGAQNLWTYESLPKPQEENHTILSIGDIAFGRYMKHLPREVIVQFPLVWLHIVDH